MSKFESKARELLARVQDLLDSFKIVKSTSYGIPDDYYAPDEVLNQYPEVLLDVQTLFFCDSPQNPLYVRAMELNKRMEWVAEGGGNKYYYSDFVTLRNLLLKYCEYRSFFDSKD